MNRFQKKRGFSLSQLTLPASILIFLLIFLLFYKGVGSVSQTASEQQMENLQQAIGEAPSTVMRWREVIRKVWIISKNITGSTYNPRKNILMTTKSSAPI